MIVFTLSVVFQPVQWSATLSRHFDCSWNPCLFGGTPEMMYIMVAFMLLLCSLSVYVLCTLCIMYTKYRDPFVFFYNFSKCWWIVMKIISQRTFARAPTFYGLVADLSFMLRIFFTDLLRGSHQLVSDLLRGNWC